MLLEGGAPQSKSFNLSVNFQNPNPNLILYSKW